MLVPLAIADEPADSREQRDGSFTLYLGESERLEGFEIAFERASEEAIGLEVNNERASIREGSRATFSDDDFELHLLNERLGYRGDRGDNSSVELKYRLAEVGEEDNEDKDEERREDRFRLSEGSNTSLNEFIVTVEIIEEESTVFIVNEERVELSLDDRRTLIEGDREDLYIWYGSIHSGEEPSVEMYYYLRETRDEAEEREVVEERVRDQEIRDEKEERDGGEEIREVDYPQPEEAPQDVEEIPEEIPDEVLEMLEEELGLEECNGCEYQGECISHGTRMNETYCNIEGEMVDQLEEGASCENDFECMTNECSSGECVDLAGELEEQRSILNRIMSWLGLA